MSGGAMCTQRFQFSTEVTDVFDGAPLSTSAAAIVKVSEIATLWNPLNTPVMLPKVLALRRYPISRTESLISARLFFAPYQWRRDMRELLAENVVCPASVPFALNPLAG